VSLGPFFYNNCTKASERAKAGKPAGAKPRIYGLHVAVKEDGREETRAAGLPESCFGALQPPSSKLKTAVFCWT
jgi:hypothetical protein